MHFGLIDYDDLVGMDVFYVCMKQICAAVEAS